MKEALYQSAFCIGRGILSSRRGKIIYSDKENQNIALPVAGEVGVAGID